MKTKQDIMQFRVDKKLKDQLFREAKRIGISPSELVRRLVKAAVEEDPKLKRLEEGEQDLRITVMDIMKCLQKMSLKTSWEEARLIYQDTLLGQILDQELYLYYAKIKRHDLYYKERDELWDFDQQNES
jgi:hypothetical protein